MWPALALVHACATLIVESDDPALRELVQSAFASRADIDSCARVSLTTRGAGTIVTVTLPDGRTTTRIVRSDDVIDTLEPLLLVPEGPEPPPSQPLTMRVESPEPVVVITERDAPSSPRTKPRHLAIEGSVSLSARVADWSNGSTQGAGTLASVTLDANGWLAGIAGRAEHYETYAESPSGTRLWPLQGMDVIAVSATAGRRVRMGFASLDFVGGAGIADLWATKPVGQLRLLPKGQDAESDAWIGSTVVPQLVFGTRLTLGTASPVRVFLGLDGELRLASPPELPTWSMGASIGLTVGS